MNSPGSSRIWFLLVAAAAMLAACTYPPAGGDAPVKVEILQTKNGYQLLRGGEPYRIRGAGMSFADLAAFAAHGGNSIRNWTTRDGVMPTRELLDQAHAHGITVALGLPMVSERSGFDYDDAAAVAEQFAELRSDVLEYRDHPALLFWIVGNELNHSYTNPAVFDAVHDVVSMIHDLDPNHPATTTIAGYGENVITDIRERAPSLDFISFQVYRTLFGLPQQLERIGFDAPFMVTEWGTIGYWEVEETSWGAPIEATSSEKADTYRRGYAEILPQFEDRLIGNYAFYWGQKQERTPTWFGLFTEHGHETESIDVLHAFWSGSPPVERSPQLVSLRLDGKAARDDVHLQSGADYEAQVEAVDPDGDSLSYRWELKPESRATQAGGDFESPIANLHGFIDDPETASPRITAPPPGAYRLFVYVFDGQGKAAHANLPFLAVPAD